MEEHGLLCWLNGVVQPLSQASVPVTDRGFLYGDSLFETIRVARARPLLLSAHLNRLQEGARALDFTLPAVWPELESACMRMIEANNLDEGVLRIALTRGIAARGPSPARAHSPTLLVTAGPLPPELPERRRRGCRIVLSPWRKPAPDMLPSAAKTGNYLNSILAFQSALRQDADEALLLDAQNRIAECSYSNIFFGADGALITPSLDGGALPGIVRQQVLDLAGKMNLPVRERAIALADLSGMNEAFLTNSVIGVMPVASIEEINYPVAGPLTRRLQEALARTEERGT